MLLRFVPASEADRWVIESYLPDLPPDGGVLDPAALPSSLPGYLIRLKAQLVLDDQVVAEGGSLTLGQELASETSIGRLTGGVAQAINHPVAGELHAFWIDTQGFGRQALYDLTEMQPDRVLQRAAQALFANLDMHLRLLEAAGLAVTYRLPSYGTVASRLSPIYSFGIPREVQLDGLSVDMDAITQSLVAREPTLASSADLQQQIGFFLSDMEHEIPELYLRTATDGIAGASAVKAITLALDAGQRLYEVRSDNVDSALAQLQQSEAIEQDIRNAAHAGLVAYVHEAPVELGTWSGTGYLLLDVATGSGAFRISSGANGFEARQAELAAGFTLFGIGVLGRRVTLPTQADLNAAINDCGGADERSRIRIPWTETLSVAIILALLAIITKKAGGRWSPSPAPAFTAATNFAIVANAAKAAQSGKACPVYLIGYYSPRGKPMYEYADHIRDAQPTSPSVLTNIYPDGHPREWLDDTTTCGPEARQAEAQMRGTSTAAIHCDEYPFSSAAEGGEENYYENHWVSLRFILGSHNTAGGGTLSGFTTKCKVFKNDRFRVETWNGVTKYYTDETKTTECP